MMCSITLLHLDVSDMDRKFAGLLRSPFLNMLVILAFFQSSGVVP